MTSDRELLLYLVAKVARLDAIVSAIHTMQYTHNRPKENPDCEAYRIATQSLYADNIAGEQQHLQTQFPDEYEILLQHIDLGESETKSMMDQRIGSMLTDLLETIVDTDEMPPEPNDDDEDANIEK